MLRSKSGPMTDASPLPPDVAAARKHRINSELVVLFKRPCPPNSNPTAKGIGLYTHVEAPAKTPQFPHERYVKSDPVFLPIGGARRVGRTGILGAQMSDEIRQVWKDLRDAVDEEEKVTGNAGSSAEDLKERYGGLDVPEKATYHQVETPMRRLQLNDHDSAMQVDSTGQHSATTPVTPSLEDQRQAWATWLSRGSGLIIDPTSMADPKRRDSAPKAGNMYESERDPRKQGR